MPSTGDIYGLPRTSMLDERRSPVRATRAAAHHFRDLFLRFGSWDLALAAYNMGYEQLLDAVDKYGTTDFNELARQDALPAETAAYVPKIGAVAIIANNLEHFGFDNLELAPPMTGAEIAVPAGTSLGLIARAGGVATSVIRALNPDILGSHVPTGHGDFIVTVPAAAVSQVRAALPVILGNETTSAEDSSALAPLSLSEGRALLEKQASWDDENLLGLLPHYRPHRIRAAPNNAADETGGGDDGESDGSWPDPAAEQRQLLVPQRRHRRETLLYRVAEGDTMASLAREFGLSLATVGRLSRLSPSRRLTPGSFLRLRLPVQAVDELGASRRIRRQPHNDDAQMRTVESEARKEPPTPSARSRRATVARGHGLRSTSEARNPGE
jgi:membrane-bound lytic murein transglycosylase D